MLCEVASGEVSDISKVWGLGFLSFVNVFGRWSISRYEGRLWRWFNSKGCVGGCGC